MGNEAVCPECVQDKHGNCDGTAWDFEADQPTSCRCSLNGHASPDAMPVDADTPQEWGYNGDG